MEERTNFSCRVCGGTILEDLGPCNTAENSIKALFPSGEPPDGCFGHLIRCCQCGMGQRVPALSFDELDRIYAGMKTGQMSYPFETNAAWVHARKLLLKKWLPTDVPKVLDIGCYDGRFLSVLPDKWEKFGVEPSEDAAEEAKNKGIRILPGNISDSLSKLHGFFDVVCMFDVMEHLLDPEEGIVNAAKYLKPGGQLMFSTASFDAYPFRWLKGYFWYIETPLHVSFLSPSFIRWVVREAQLRISAIHRIPHRNGRLKDRIKDFIITVYFASRMRGRFYRIPLRMMQSVPAWRYLMHKKQEPSTFLLKDHMFVILVKGHSGPRISYSKSVCS